MTATEQIEACAFPASVAQERLWLLDQLQPGDATYHIAGAVRFKGDLDVSALDASLRHIVGRHESLRTTFQEIDGEVIQIVRPESSTHLEVLATDLSIENNKGAFLDNLAALARLPFDLSQGALLRAKLLKSGPRDHTLLLAMHHIVSDGWSLMVLIEELVESYKAFTAGAQPELPPLPIQYPDYAVWQKNYLANRPLEAAIAYWNEKLSTSSSCTVPADYARPPVQAHRGAKQSLQLSRNTCDVIMMLCHREQSTPFMLLLAVFKILLSRYTASNDVLVGTPIAGRSRVELERLVGCFVNVVALRTELAERASFLQVLRQVKDVTLQAYSHEDLPFERVLMEVNPARDLSQAPLFQVFFNMIKFPEALEISLPGVETELIDVPETRSKFDLTFYVKERAGQISFDLVYDTDLFAPERISEMLKQYEYLLKQAAIEPDKQIDSFSLVTETARAVLPEPTAPLDPRWQGAVHQLFHAQCQRSPSSLAVHDARIQLTYKELDDSSSRLANHLLNLGLSNGDVIAIYAHRSLALATALLGVMKTGAAFLILDPDYPTARLLDYVTLSRVRALIKLEAAGPVPEAVAEYVKASKCFSVSVPETRSGVVDSLAAEFSTEMPNVNITADTLAYIAFTSGSTGRPKGVRGKHGSLSHFVPWLRKTFSLSEADRFSVFSGLSHDALHRDLFLPLMLGASAWMPDEEEWKLPGNGIRWAARNQISIVNVTPATGQLIMSGGATPTAMFKSLRYAFFVGDVLKRQDIHCWRAAAPVAIVVNLYGATETQQSLSFFVDHSPASQRMKEIVPLGQGFEDVQLLVVNRRRQLCGIGEAGEIYFRSPHLAAGYLEDEELSNERFVANWFSGRTDDLLYRTGDLGRYLPNGAVETLGRADRQVKIRGFRIELAEIEAALSQHAGVRQSVVLAREDNQGHPQLVAYVLLKESGGNWEHDLFRFVAERLPSYMVPAGFVKLDAFPLTPNGKLDRKALPPPSWVAAPVPDTTRAWTEVETLIAGIVGQVLGLEQVGLRVSFFELGGHSLLATQVISRVRNAFRVAVPLRALFEHPTVEALAKDVESALHQTSVSTLPLIKTERGKVAPLSFAQERLWFLDQLEPGGTNYILAAAVQLIGRLDVAALEQTFERLVERHETLRTRFEAVGGRPVQVVEQATPLRVGARHVGAEQELRAELNAFVREPFDLERRPLMRVALWQLADQEHLLALSLHHIVFDGWSTGVLIGDLCELYAAIREERAAQLPELSIQYADYALWQRQWLAGKSLQREVDYWRGQLADYGGVVELPTDHPRQAKPTHRGETLTRLMCAQLSGKLQQFSLREGVTLFMTLLAGLDALLYRYTGQRDLAIGTPVANRNRVDTEPLIGFFVNTLVLRTAVGPQDSFRQLLQQIRETALEAYLHQDVPFEKVVEELRPDRDLSRTQLFQVMLIVQNAPMAAFNLPELELRPLPVDTGSVNFELTVAVTDTAEGLAAAWQYSTELFEQSTITRMAQQYERLLEGAIKDAEQRIADLPLLSDSERRHILEEWNATSEQYPHELCIHELIAEQAARTPDAIAVEFGRIQLSYAELETRANRLARYLRRLGVGPETRVGVCLERSADILIAVTGVLKAGCAYVPLDASYPSGRLTYALQDSQASVLLTHKALVQQFPSITGTVIRLDADWPRIANECGEPLARTAAPGNLAYVIYTSGSTGKPKGVQIEHRAVVNFLWSMRAAPGIQPDDILLAVTTLSFDIAGLEIYLPLVAGARVRILSREASVDAERLMAAVSDGITMMQATPASWLLLLESGWNGNAGLRALCGGESVPTELAKELAVKTRSAWNMYGPTETTIWSVTGQMQPLDDRVSIGRPIANTQVYVLDCDMGPVPLGATGELYIGGDGLARGYWNRGDLTAERFIPNPFSRGAGERLYRTGDLARYLPDGGLEFLGRSDSQIKLRGYRIELGEIEAALRHTHGVKQAVVVTREDKPGEKRMVAYVVQDPEIRLPDFRGSLKQTLPAYMIPSAFVILEALPLTPNGKVDRKALPPPTADEGPRPEDYAAPRTFTEEIIAGIWADVLRLAQVGVDQNFFALGGYSLLATQVVSRIRAAFGVELPLRALFEQPTVTQLAHELESRTPAGKAAANTSIAPVIRKQHPPFSYAQQRLWFIDQLEPGRATYNIPIGVRLEGELDIEALRLSVQEIVRRHDVLRTRFENVNGSPRQVIEDPHESPLQMVDFSGLGEQELLAHMSAEASQTFDLSKGPLFRTTLLRLSAREHVLLATMHHIVSDGWSTGVLIEELTILYASYTRQQRSPLTDLQIQYADYALWQRNWLQGEILEQQIGYWRQQLDGLEPLELPVDYIRPPALSGHGAAVAIQLNSATTQRLFEFSRCEGVTLFMVMLAAWQVLLSRYSRQRDIAVGTDVANRNRIETEKLIGFFVNQLVLRTHIDVAERFTSLLQRVRAMTLAAYEHQDVPFEKLVEELAPGRDLSRSALFQVKLVLDRAPQQELLLEGLRVSTIETKLEFTKLDLRLGLTEQRDGTLDGRLEYSTDLFACETVERITRHWVNLMEGIAAHPHHRISELPLLSKQERSQLLTEWNCGAEDFSRATVMQLFECHPPDGIAVVYEDQRLSYGELNRRANQLGHYLRRLGVGPEVRVALCAERGLEMVIGMIGVLKAGGAYVPLDPGYPAERLSYMLEDTQAPVLLTQARLQDHLPSGWTQVVLLDEDWIDIEQQPCDAPHPGVTAQNLAFVLFTSGSTGNPKGVAVEHQALSNYVGAVTRALDLPHKASYALVSTMAADLGYTGIFGALCGGGTLHVLVEERVLDPDAMSEYFERHGIECCKAVPSLWQALTRGKRARAVMPRRRLILGGEALSWPLIQEIQALGSDCRIYNHYGPSETTVGVLTAAITWAENRRAGTVPVGKPIANTQVYVLDEDQAPVPIGVSGELYIGGAGLARGYLNRPSITAEKFVPDPFKQEVGGRLYRTGDLVKWRADEQLEFVGRIDHQVKLRGYRIELGEIETALCQHAEVEGAAVLLREDTPGDKKLVAYVIARNAQVNASQLRNYLKERLPDYMAPSAFVFVPELPFTSNGKLDRRALPKPQPAESGSAGEVNQRLIAAEEEILAGIWAEVLRVETVGRQDNFFDLGGHSLLATQVISRVRDAFDVELPLRSVFDSPTVAGMLEHLKHAQGQGREKTPAFRRREHEGEIPLSYAQQRFWFLDQLSGSGSVYHVSMVMELHGELNVAVLRQSFGEIVRRHEMLRTRLPVHDGYPVQIVEPATEWRLPIVDLSGLEKGEAEVEADRIVRQQQKQPFDLAQGPLLRTLLLRLGPEDHLLICHMHHLAADGWSIELLTQEMSRLYESYRQGRASDLPELPIQYADYTLWEREWLSGETLETRLRYWRRQLEGAEVELRLPQQRHRPAVQSFRGAREPVYLPIDLADRLRAFSRREGTTLFMTMLAGFVTLLHQYTRQEDLVVGSVIANRERAELERLVGFLANTLVLRVDLSGDLSFRQLLQRVRETCLQAYAHQLPPEKLMEETARVRDGERQPLYQVWFQLGTQPRESLELGGLEWRRVEGKYSGDEHVDSRFELSLTLHQSDAGITGDFKYDSDLFSSKIIRQLIEDYTSILEQVPHAPEASIAEIGLAEQQETKELAGAFSGSLNTPE